MAERVLCLIDGFNYFHRLDDYYGETEISYKWLNYASLISEQIKELKIVKNKQRQELELTNITFFTSIDKKSRDKFTDEQKRERKQEKHELYIKALESVGVKILYGKFNYSTVECKRHGCGHSWLKPSEKMTDVNIAVALLNGAMQDEYDVCFLLTGDTDLIPAIKAVRTHFPTKVIVVFQPPDCKFENQFGKKPGHNLRIAHEFNKLQLVTHKIFQFQNFKQHQFSQALQINDSGETITSPWPNPTPSLPQ